MEKNKKHLIELMKIMKKSDFKSRFTFMLGAGFANHVYKFPLWSGIVEKYLKDKKIKLEELTSFEKQLILDYAEETENFYTKELNSQKQVVFYQGFKDFYYTLKSNDKIATGFFTTNHCKSIEKYFDINNIYNFDIKTIRQEIKDFQEQYFKNEIIINIHGTTKSKNAVFTSNHYHELFSFGYNRLFEILSIVNNKQNDEIENSVLFIFGSSLEEKHLIALLKSVYKEANQNIFYINHKSINENILDIFSKQGFKYISTCQDKQKKTVCEKIDICNNNFFIELNMKINQLYKTDKQASINYQNSETEKIINEIISIEKYIFGDTVNLIDNLIKDRQNKSKYTFRTNNFDYYFLWTYLSKNKNIEENKNIENLYLYYFEKNNNNWKNLFDSHRYFENNKKYFVDFLKIILKNEKLKLDEISTRSYLFNIEEGVVSVFNKLFSELKKTESLDLIYKFYTENKKIELTSLGSPNQLLYSLQEFKIKTTYEKLDNLFKFKAYDGDIDKYNQFKENLFLILFIYKFFSLSKKSTIRIIEFLFIDIESIKEISFTGDGFNKPNSIDIYITNYKFIKYIFPLYIKMKNIKLSPLNTFNSETSFNAKNTNFLLNYYYHLGDEDKPIINDYFIDINLNKKIFKMMPSGVAYTVSHDIKPKILEQYSKKWKNFDWKKIVDSIVQDFEINPFVENTEEKIKILKDRVNDLLKKENWNNKLKELANYFLKLDVIIKNKFWSDWNFLLKMITEKYIENKGTISLLLMDDFFINYIPEKYLKSQEELIHGFWQLINLNKIKKDDFSQLHKIKSTWIFKNFIELLEINHGSIYSIFITINNLNNNQKYDLFSIWKKVFTNKKESKSIINRIMENTSVDDEKYKKYLSEIFTQVFLDNEINLFKKASYFYFDYYEYKKLVKNDSRWYFVNEDFKELNKFVKQISYTSNTKSIDINQSIIIKHQFKRLFFYDNYDKTNLLYKIVFDDKTEILKTKRDDFILAEINLIYQKFYSTKTKKFNEILNEKDIEYMCQLLMRMSNFQISNNDETMINDMHNFYEPKYQNLNIRNNLSNLSKSISSFINSVQYRNLDKSDQQKTSNDLEEIDAERNIWTFKFCLLKLTNEQLKKELKKYEQRFIDSTEYEEKIIKCFQQIKCKIHKIK